MTRTAREDLVRSSAFVIIAMLSCSLQGASLGIRCTSQNPFLFKRLCSVVIAKNHTGYETTSEERAISEFYARYSVTNEVLR
jgi:hypothetical protein